MQSYQLRPPLPSVTSFWEGISSIDSVVAKSDKSFDLTVSTATTGIVDPLIQIEFVAQECN